MRWAKPNTLPVDPSLKALYFITHAIYRLNKLYIGGNGLHFFTQVLDVAINGSVVDDPVPRVDVIEQLIAAKNSPHLVRQCRQQFKFYGCYL